MHSRFVVTLEKLDEIRELRNRLNLSHEQFARLLNTSVANVFRWEQGLPRARARGPRTPVRPSPTMARKLGRLKAVVDRFGSDQDPKGVVAFLSRPHPELLGHRPIDALDSDLGYDMVVGIVEAAFSGSFA